MDIDAANVLCQRDLGSKVHGPGTPEEMERMHEVAMESDLVKKEIARLKLIDSSDVICEPWPYGKDGIDDNERLFQVFPPFAWAKRSATFSSHPSTRITNTHHGTTMLTLSTSPASSTASVVKSSASNVSHSRSSCSPVHQMMTHLSRNRTRNTPLNYNPLSAKISNHSTSRNLKASVFMSVPQTMKSCHGKNGDSDSHLTIAKAQS